MNDPFVSRPPARERKLRIDVIRCNKKYGLDQSFLIIGDRVVC
jgi:hypothetical protein